VEQTLEDLANSKCIAIEEDDVSPLNLGMIAAYYYINYVTIEAFSLSLRQKTKLRGLLEIVSSAAEFEEIPIRHHEDGLLKRIYDRVPVKIENANFNDPHLKTAILLQAHFSRLTLPADLESDQKLILAKVVRLLQACVDVVSSNGWLPPALSAMELCQMSIQALWDRDSPLKQIPHISDETIQQLNAEGVEGIFDLMELEDSKRNSILSLEKAKLADVARFVNQYPNIDVQFEMDSENVEAGDVVTVVISLEREGEEDESEGPVIAPFYPFKKDEGWWLVIGNPADKTLLAIKRTSFGVKTTTKLEFNAPNTVGPLVCKMYLMSDSYLGVDQEFDLCLNITEAQDESQEEDAMEQD
jgi:pre-mRNA-splicing helicase BRR2